MTEATDSSLNFLMALFILVPAVVIAVIAIVMKEVGNNNDPRR